MSQSILSDGSDWKFPSKDDNSRLYHPNKLKPAFQVFSKKKYSNQLTYRPNDSMNETLQHSGCTGMAPLNDSVDVYSPQQEKRPVLIESLLKEQKKGLGLKIGEADEATRKLNL